MNVFFLAGTPESLEGSYGHLAIDDGGAVFDLDPEHPVNRYRVSSDIEEAAASDLRTAGTTYPPDVVSSYLHLPALDRRIPQLAEQITASANNNYDKAWAVETYLRTHFGYTLQLSRTIPHDPLANFLFERKQGHCEYFASSMAVMLRSLGIPVASRQRISHRRVQRSDLAICRPRQQCPLLGGSLFPKLWLGGI